VNDRRARDGTREADASTCEQSAARQSLVSMVVGDKNRCVPDQRPGARAARFGAGFESWQE
jgi:hypothetical protein